MSKPTGKLLFAYNTIKKLEAEINTKADYNMQALERITELESEIAKLIHDMERGQDHNLELLDEVSALKESMRGYKAMEDAYVQKISDLKTEIELMTTEDK